MANEIKNLEKVLNEGERPITAIMGGAKVSSKISIINKLMDKVDKIIIGGGMSYTFAKALGGNVGNSLVEDDKMELALSLISQAKRKRSRITYSYRLFKCRCFPQTMQTPMLAILTKFKMVGWDLISAKKRKKNYRKAILSSKNHFVEWPNGSFRNG
ncbi:MAG: hypothetical protein CM15mP23_16080 [Cryomorphaceae bacterium]|nr:MAG: hypothetical protein CM15mP23_16080 [Cryomorphaceae bacterium]